MLADRHQSDPLFDPPSLPQFLENVAQDVEPTWIIKHLLPSDNLILCSGQAKEAKKSWFCMLVALVCATGKSLPGLECIEKVPVLYIYREGARKATAQRFRALAAGQGLGRAEDIHNLFFCHRGDFRLDDERSIESAENFIRLHGIKMVVIDTFAKSFGGDENNAQQIGNAIRQAEKIRNAGTTVILVHHPRKSAPELSNGKEGYPEPDHDLRGSGNLAGSYETHWAIRSYGAQGGESAPIMIVSSKEGEKSAYNYAWDFEQHEDATVKTARLNFSKKSELPYIQTEKSRGRESTHGFGGLPNDPIQ